MAVADTLEAIKSLFNQHKIQPCVDGSLSIKETDKKVTLRLVKLDAVGASAFAVQYDNDTPERALFMPVQTGKQIYIRQILGKYI